MVDRTISLEAGLTVGASRKSMYRINLMVKIYHLMI